MKNIKVTDLDLSVVKAEDFANKSSYRRFMKGLLHVVEVQKLKDQGALLFIEGTVLPEEENFIFGDISDGATPVFGTGDGSCMMMWLGCTFCPETGKVYVEAKEMEIFNKISYVDPKSIKKMRKLK